MEKTFIVLSGTPGQIINLAQVTHVQVTMDSAQRKMLVVYFVGPDETVCNISDATQVSTFLRVLSPAMINAAELPEENPGT